MSDTLYDYIINTGVIVPDIATLLSDVQSEFSGALGAGMNPDSSTPQGVAISAETTARSSVIQNNALLANQINPNLAGGMFLDAVAALSGLEREADTYTVVQGVTLAGVQGSPIGAGAVVTDGGGNAFALVNNVTLDAVSGLAVGIYQAETVGPVTCQTGTMNIVTDVLGLETVTNPGTAVSIGMAQQSDEEFRVLRRNTLALQGVSLREAGQSALWDLDGVIGVQTLENQTGSTVVNSGVTLIAKSFWACVDGGIANDIGTVLLENKSYGCDWNGAQTIDVTEPASGQIYVVNYDIPTEVPLVVQVTVRQGTYQGNPLTDVPPAVVAFATNQVSTVPGFTVGENASPFEIASGILAQLPGLYVSSVQISLKSSVSFAPTEIAMLLFQKATVLATDVTVNFAS